MSIINIQTQQVGLVGTLPSLAYINTSDTVATVTTTGYLNKEVANGVSFSLPCLAVVSTKATPTSASVPSVYNVTHVGDNWSLVAQTGGGAGSVVLAPTDNQIITGQYYLYSNNLVQGYTSTPTAAGTTTLTVSSTYQQYFTGSTTQTVVLPDVSTLRTGFEFKIVNNSSGIVTVNSSGGNLVEAMDPLTQLVVTCISTSGTTAASWDTDYTSDILPVPLADGGTNAALTASNGGVFYSTGTAGAILAGTATANRVLLSGASTTPAWSTATYPTAAGTSGNVLTSDGTNWVSSAPASGGTWVNQTTATVTMAANTGYTANAGASLITFTLPATSAVGDYVEINGKDAGLWRIAQTAGQQIRISPNATTLGVGGSLASVNQYDNVRLRCITANTIWTVVSQQSTGLTVV